LATGFLNGTLHLGANLARYALITLAMVIGTDIEYGVLLLIVPADELGVRLLELEERLACTMLALFNLCQEPRPTDDGTGLEELQRTGGLHLAADDTGQVLLYRQYINGHNLAFLHHELQFAQEGLRLLPFPVELFADGNSAETERDFVRLRPEGEVVVYVTIPLEGSVLDGHLLFARNDLAFGAIFAIEREGELLGGHDAHTDLGFLF